MCANNEIKSLVIAEPEERSKYDNTYWFQPLSDFIKRCRVGIDAVL